MRKVLKREIGEIWFLFFYASEWKFLKSQRVLLKWGLLCEKIRFYISVLFAGLFEKFQYICRL